MASHYYIGRQELLRSRLENNLVDGIVHKLKEDLLRVLRDVWIFV